MSSDTTNTVVVAIQGVAVSSAPPTDGYVLTYVDVDSEWEPKPSIGLQSQIFLSSGMWTCPNNVFNIMLVGSGGGGGRRGVGGNGSNGVSSGNTSNGGNAANNTGAGGGEAVELAAIQVLLERVATVDPDI